MQTLFLFVPPKPHSPKGISQILRHSCVALVESFSTCTAIANTPRCGFLHLNFRPAFHGRFLSRHCGPRRHRDGQCARTLLPKLAPGTLGVRGSMVASPPLMAGLLAPKQTRAPPASQRQRVQGLPAAPNPLGVGGSTVMIVMWQIFFNFFSGTDRVPGPMLPAVLAFYLVARSVGLMILSSLPGFAVVVGIVGTHVIAGVARGNDLVPPGPPWPPPLIATGFRTAGRAPSPGLLLRKTGYSTE